MANIWDYEVRRQIYQKYNGRCAYCGCSLENDYSIDHIEPTGKTTICKKRHLEVIENYNPCCKSCNSSKWHRNIEEWREHIEVQKRRIFRNHSNVRLLDKFGLISVSPDPVVFYFERCGVAENITNNS